MKEELGRRTVNRRRKRWLIIGLFVLALIWTNPVGAQDTLPIPFPQESELTIQQLRVQVMPEFDDPRVLVIVQGRVSATASELPQPVTFHLPRGAQINQMAVMNVATGETLSQPYDALPDPDDPAGTLVTYTLNDAHFFYEYYYDPLAGEVDKLFTYRFLSPQPVEDLLIEVQQPLTATDFTMNPLATIARFDEIFGLTYHQFRVGELPAGEPVTLSISYTKTDPNPSVSREELASFFAPASTSAGTAPTTNPAHRTTTTRPGTLTLPTWSIFLIGGILLASGMSVIYYRRGHSTTPNGRGKPTCLPSSPDQKLSGQAQGTSPTMPDNVLADNLCPQCTTELRKNARFCQACGATVSKGEVPPLVKVEPLAPATHHAPRFTFPKPRFTPRWVAGAGIAILLVSLFWWANTSNSALADAPLDRETMVAGAQVYVAYCGECHGGQAEGTAQAPPLNSFGTTYLHSDVELRRIMHEGQGGMPGWRGTLSPQEIESVIYFIKRQWTPEQRLQQGDLS